MLSLKWSRSLLIYCVYSTAEINFKDICGLHKYQPVCESSIWFDIQKILSHILTYNWLKNVLNQNETIFVCHLLKGFFLFDLLELFVMINEKWTISVFSCMSYDKYYEPIYEHYRLISKYYKYDFRH